MIIYEGNNKESKMTPPLTSMGWMTMEQRFSDHVQRRAGTAAT